MAFPAFTGIASELDTAGVSFNVSMPASVNADALLMMCVAYENNNLGVPDPGTPTDWTLLDSVSTNSGKDAFTVVYVKKAVGDEGGTSVTLTTSMNCVAAAHVLNITGWGGTIATDVDIGTAANVAVSNPDPPTVTAGGGAADNLFVVYLGSYVNLGTVSTYPTGFTEAVAQALGGDTTDGAAIATCYLESTNATEDPDAFALSEVERCHLNTIVVAPGTAGNGGGGGGATIPFKLVGPGGLVGISGGLVA